MMNENDLVTRYGRWCLGTEGHAESTVALRRSYLLRLCRAADPLTCTAEDIGEWMATHTWKPETRKAVRVTLRGFFRWIHERGLRPDNPTAAMRPVRVPRACAHPAPDVALARARLLATGEERLMLECAAQLGLRRGEVASIRGDAIEGGVLYVTGKGGDERALPIPDELAEQILERGPGWTFPGRFPGTHTTSDRVGRILSRLLGPGVTSHGLRHRWATRAYSATHDLLAVQQALGHANPTTTQIYIRVNLDNLRAAVRAAA